MKTPLHIFFLFLPVLLSSICHPQTTTSPIDFFGEAVQVPSTFTQKEFKSNLSNESIAAFIDAIDSAAVSPFLNVLLHYKEKFSPDDWLYYQLVRKVAERISPKAENYNRYTIYKWWLLIHSGYDAALTFSGNYLLFYVQSDEAIYNIPYRMRDGKQYVCLNYHDYGTIDFDKNKFGEVALSLSGKGKAFSYKVTHLPDFKLSDYTDKEVRFDYYANQYNFRIKLNPQVKTIFNNYPVVDYEMQCNMPLSHTTYQSLIPSLKQNISKLSVKDGVDFLMRFTRYAFLFKPDGEVYGGEKRMSPEQTLMYDYSDCEDRAALFFYLVKEIYNLPMLVLTYPRHVTVAVKFEKPFGKTIDYNGAKYSICEPTPQKYDLLIGQGLPELKKQTYEIEYAYRPR